MNYMFVISNVEFAGGGHVEHFTTYMIDQKCGNKPLQLQENLLCYSIKKQPVVVWSWCWLSDRIPPLPLKGPWQQFRPQQIYIVSVGAEDVSVCWWMPSPTITPQSRKHMKRIFGHSFLSVTTFPKRQRAAGRRGAAQQAGAARQGGRSRPLFVPHRTGAETRRVQKTTAMW